MASSKTQIDKLGERLKAGGTTEADLRELDEYRRSFTAAYESVVSVVRDRLNLEPTGRLAKTTPSIIDKAFAGIRADLERRGIEG